MPDPAIHPVQITDPQAAGRTRRLQLNTSRHLPEATARCNCAGHADHFFDKRL